MSDNKSVDIPDEAVEAAAGAYYERGGGQWADVIPEYRAEEVADMRAALEAAAPSLLAKAWEEGYGASTTDAFAASRSFVGKLPNPYEASK